MHAFLLYPHHVCCIAKHFVNQAIGTTELRLVLLVNISKSFKSVKKGLD